MLQGKLRVGRRDDPLERAADRAADQVLSGRQVEAPGGAAEQPQRMCAECEEEQDTVQRQAEEEEEEEVVQRQVEEEEEEEVVQRQVEEEEEEEVVQPKFGGSAARAGGAETAAAAVSSGGRPMSPAERAYFEPRFGRELSAVRLHDGAPAQRAAAAINARAYTLGSSIAFAAGELRPETRAGRRLLAHELAHVVQQRGGRANTVRRAVSTRSRCPASVHGAPADPIAQITSADARAQLMTLGTSHLLFLESVVLGDPTFGPRGQATRAYEERFGKPERRGRRFRNRFNRKRFCTEREAQASEMRSLSRRFERISRRLSRSIRYRCPGTRRIRVGGCRHRCGSEFAWNCSPSNRSTIALCRNFWTHSLMASVDQKAGNLVHEGAHLEYVLPRHRHGNVRQRGRNSECYEAAVADIYGFTAEVDDCPKVTPSAPRPTRCRRRRARRRRGRGRRTRRR